MVAAENAISQARSFWSVQTRSGRVVEAAGFANSPGALGGRLRRNRTGFGLPPRLPRPNCLLNDILMFQGWIDVATGHA